MVKNLQESVAAKEIKSGVTFPEGYTMDQIFQKLEDEGICSVEDLYDAAANYHYDFSFLDDSTLGVLIKDIISESLGVADRT